MDSFQGYGGMLMDHFKAHIRNAYPNMMHFLTYADNYAVGYFEKQGFSKDISLDRSLWAGYIKDYEGGTIMQCKLLRKVDYLNKPALLARQKEAILSRIKQMSRSHIIYPGLPQFQPGQPERTFVDPRDVPGLRKYSRVSFGLPSLVNAPQGKLVGRAAWRLSKCSALLFSNSILNLYTVLVFHHLRMPIVFLWKQHSTTCYETTDLGRFEFQWMLTLCWITTM